MRIFGRRPLTRLEAALYAAIAASLAAWLASVLLDSLELAERSAVELTINRANVAINVRLAYELLRGRPVEAVIKRNPFDVAQMSPENFRGTVADRGLQDLERGSWYYDEARGELLYLPRLRRHLESGDPSGAIRFHFAKSKGLPYMLAPTHVYQWAE